MNSLPLNPAEWFPMPAIMEDGNHRVVNIPRMSAEAFDRFKKALEFFRDGIVMPPEKEQQ